MKTALLHRFTVVILIGLLLTSCSNDETTIDSFFGIDLPKDTLDSYLESKMDEMDIPGLSIAIVNKGEVVHRKNFGYANREQKLPVTDTTIFEGASISKSVFAFFVMTFVEEGKLDLDRPLFTYMPYPDIAHDERYKQITARMVLSHRSGFPNWREDRENGKLTIKFDPGTSYEYSGEGYQYLAKVLAHIEDTDGKGLEAIFQEKIAKPLDMKHTVFLQTPYTRSHKAEPYDADGNRIAWEDDISHQRQLERFGAAYSIHTEPLDFSKWMRAVMDKKILSHESYDQLFEPHSKIPDTDLDISYTLGFFAMPFPFSDSYGHGGDNEGFTCFYSLNTDKDWGFVLFTNSEYGQQLGEQLFEYLIFGPDLTVLYISAAVIGLLIIFGIGYGVRSILRRWRRRKKIQVQ